MLHSSITVVAACTLTYLLGCKLVFKKTVSENHYIWNYKILFKCLSLCVCSEFTTRDSRIVSDTSLRSSHC